MQEWRKFLLEEEVKFQGILKIELPPVIVSEIDALRSMLPEEAVRLDPEDLHVTLAHQSVLKPFSKQLEKIKLPDPPRVVLDDQIFERTSPGKKSWAVRVANQKEMREYVKNIMEILGSQNTNPEPERVFHVSLANLTGNPHDSVK
jgi:2'-5' RNA ligase